MAARCTQMNQRLQTSDIINDGIKEEQTKIGKHNAKIQFRAFFMWVQSVHR